MATPSSSESFTNYNQIEAYLNTYEDVGTGKHTWIALKNGTQAELQSESIATKAAAEAIAALYNKHIGSGVCSCVAVEATPGYFTLRVSVSKITEIEDTVLKKHPQIAELFKQNTLEAKDPLGKTALLLAAESGSELLVRLLISYGADKTIKEENGETAFYLACKSGDLNSVKLLYNPVELETRGTLNKTPLHAAAEKGHAKIIAYLLEKGADPSDEDINENSAFQHACASGDLDSVKLFCTEDQLEDKDGEEKTFLIRAAKCGRANVIQYLLEKGARIDAQDADGNDAFREACRNGNLELLGPLSEAATSFHNLSLSDYLEEGSAANEETSLHIAAKGGHSKVIACLLGMGADSTRDFTDKNGNTAFQLACESNDLESVKLLFDKNQLEARDENKKTPLIRAAGSGNASIIRYLLEMGARIDVKDDDGNDAFLEACRKGNLKAVKLLYGVYTQACLGSENKAKETALHLAAKGGYSEIISYLLERGASMSAKDIDGLTAFQIACESSDLDSVKLLFDEGQLEARDENNKTPLIKAARSGNTAIIQYLLGKGARIDAKDSYGNDAFLEACRRGDHRVIELLYKVYPQACLESVNNAKKTALHLAVESGNAFTILYLIKIGAKADAKDINGNTALHRACYYDDGYDSNHIASFAMVGALVKCSDIEATNHVGNTPLMGAISTGKYNAFELLIQNGANIEHQNRNGDTPLHLACAYEYLEIGSTLIYRISAAGKSLEVVNKRGMTPLLVAAQRGHGTQVRALLTNGAKETAQDSAGNTLFHLLCRSGNMDALEQIVTSDTNQDILDLPNHQGETPLLVAAWIHGEVIRDFLLENDVNTRVRSKNGTNLFSAACRHNDVAFIEKLIDKGEVDDLTWFFSTPSELSALSNIFEKEIASSELLLLLIELLAGKPSIPKEFFTKNHERKTPMQLALSASSLWSKYPEQMKELLAQLLKGYPAAVRRIQEHGEKGFLEYCREHALEVIGERNSFELALLLSDHLLLREIGKRRGQERLQEDACAFEAISSRSDIQELLLNAQYEMHREHLDKGLPPPKKPDGVEVSDLKKFFNTIEFPQCQPQEVMKMRLLIEKFIREFHAGIIAGMSKDGLGAKLVENAITAIIHYFQNHPDSASKSVGGSDSHSLMERKRLTMDNLLHEIELCGPKLVMTSRSLYNKAVKGEGETFAGISYNVLGDVREALLSDLVPPGEQNVHDYTSLVIAIGEECGIPGAADFKQKTEGESSVDPYVHKLEDGQINSVKKKYWENYIPSRMIEAIQTELSMNGEFRDKLSTHYEGRSPKTVGSPYNSWMSDLLTATSYAALEKKLKENPVYSDINHKKFMRSLVEKSIKRLQLTQAIASEQAVAVLTLINPKPVPPTPPQRGLPKTAEVDYTGVDTYLDTHKIGLFSHEELKRALETELLEVQEMSFPQRMVYGDTVNTIQLIQAPGASGREQLPVVPIRQEAIEQALVHCNVFTKIF